MNKVTSKKVATIASELLRSKRSSARVKKVSASDLSQRQTKKAKSRR